MMMINCIGRIRRTEHDGNWLFGDGHLELMSAQGAICFRLLTNFALAVRHLGRAQPGDLYRLHACSPRASVI